MFIQWTLNWKEDWSVMLHGWYVCAYTWEEIISHFLLKEMWRGGKEEDGSYVKLSLH